MTKSKESNYRLIEDDLSTNKYRNISTLWILRLYIRVNSFKNHFF